jgi:tetratricopeptide (TPR) repeat protein
MFVLHCRFDRPHGPLRLRAATCLIASLAIASFASTASAQPADAADEGAPEGQAAPSEEARREAGVHFTNGVELFQEEEYEGALIEFRQAYDTLPNPTVLYNIGQTYLAMRRYVEADDAFRLYLERSGDRIPEDRLADVQQRLAYLQRRIGTVRITVNVDGADVLIDGARVGTAPLDGPVRVDIGEHRVSASAEAHRPTQVTVMVAGGEEQDVSLELAESSRPEPVVVVAPPPETHEAPASHGMRIAAWTLFGSALAVAGVTAWSTADAFHGDDAYRANPTEAGYHDGRRRVNRTYGLAGGAAALGITAAVLGILGRSDDDDDVPAVAVDAGPGHLGLTYFQAF